MARLERCRSVGVERARKPRAALWRSRIAQSAVAFVSEGGTLRRPNRAEHRGGPENFARRPRFVSARMLQTAARERLPKTTWGSSSYFHSEHRCRQKKR